MTDDFTPVAVTHRGDVLNAIKARRRALGLSGEAIDHQTGLTRGHTVKIENGNRPWGKVAFAMTPAMSWLLQCLGLRLILVTDECARRLIGDCETKQSADIYTPRVGGSSPHFAASLVSYEWPVATT